jgi:hypothetical protein
MEIANQTKPVTKQSCGMISWNILNALTNPNRADVRSSMIIREIAQTERCSMFQPEVHNFILAFSF